MAQQINRLATKPLIAFLLGTMVPAAAFASSYEYRIYSKDLIGPPGFTVQGSPAASQGFGDTIVGESSAPMAFNFKNTGGRVGTLAAPVLSGGNPGDFSANPACSNVPRAGICAVSVSFSPAAPGLRSSIVTLNGVAYILSGTGIGVPHFSAVNSPAASQASGSANVGSTATPAVTLNFRSDGSAASSFVVPVFGGANPGDFSATPSCNSVAIGDLCPVIVSFKPTMAGTRTATLALNGATYTFSGTGVAVSVFTLQGTMNSSQTFNSSIVGNKATPNIVWTFKNTGSGTGSLATPSLSGTNAADFAVASTCADKSIGTSCAVTVSFTPKATGNRTASVRINNVDYALNGTGNPGPATLMTADTGTGAALATDGRTATYPTVSGYSYNVWRTTTQHTSGKFYFECQLNTLDSSGYMNGCGIVESSQWRDYVTAIAGAGYSYTANNTPMPNDNSGVQSPGYVWLAWTGGGNSQYHQVDGSYVGYAVDLDNHTLQVIVNGYTLGPFAIPAGAYHAQVQVAVSTKVTANFGQAAFHWPVPAGYTAGWN